MKSASIKNFDFIIQQLPQHCLKTLAMRGSVTLIGVGTVEWSCATLTSYPGNRSNSHR